MITTTKEWVIKNIPPKNSIEKEGTQGRQSRRKAAAVKAAALRSLLTPSPSHHRFRSKTKFTL